MIPRETLVLCPRAFVPKREMMLRPWGSVMLVCMDKIIQVLWGVSKDPKGKEASVYNNLRFEKTSEN